MLIFRYATISYHIPHFLFENHYDHRIRQGLALMNKVPNSEVSWTPRPQSLGLQSKWVYGKQSKSFSPPPPFFYPDKNVRILWKFEANGPDFARPRKISVSKQWDTPMWQAHSILRRAIAKAGWNWDVRETGNFCRNSKSPKLQKP